MKWPTGLHFLNKIKAAQIKSGAVSGAADVTTLFIIAGPCGSGKTTLLQAAYRDGLPLFGPDYMAGFRSTCKDRTYKEYDDYEEALRKKSFFQAGHVKLLSREVDLPQCVLLHVDLYQVLRGIDPSYWPRSLKRRELRRQWFGSERVEQGLASVTLGKRTFVSLQQPAENDLMMRSYLQRPFFKRFRRIVVNTVQCEYSANALQLAERKAKRRKKNPCIHERRYKYFLAPDAVAQSIHQELYASWRRNLSILNPVADLTTEVSASGDLLLNGSVLVVGWTQRF